MTSQQNHADRGDQEASSFQAGNGNPTVELPINNGARVSDQSLQFDVTDPTPTLDGKYALGERIGQGGIGTVWEAEQLVPIRRPVAIKFLRSDLVSESVVARFAMEHQALAMMNHPFIAKVHDCGVTDERVPYLVMELVNGKPLTDYCDDHRLTVAERLRLFLNICTAIEHAHQRGIIHRDLKPSNVLVAEEDGMPVPKVIDFGLAKALPWSECSDAVNQTIPGVVIGTPSYMSPEQITCDQGLDTRTDVYALGILLYELAVGKAPFALCEKDGAGWVNTFRMILNDEPERPSRRLHNSPQKAEVAAARGGDAATVGRAVRGDLESIILKAIEKQSARRYESVNALRRDIERLLSHHPVEARPSSVAYQFHKFVRRHFVAVVSSSLALLALVALSLGMTWSLVRARAAEADARNALAAELRTKERNTKAVQALAESLMYAALTQSDDPYPLLEQVIALHDIATDDAGHHCRFEPPADGQGQNRDTEVLRRALSVLSHLHQEQPSPTFRAIEAHVRNQLAAKFEEAGQWKEAEKEYRRCERDLTSLATEQPTVVAHSQRLASVTAMLGKLLVQMGRTEEGTERLRKAATIHETLNRTRDSMSMSGHDATTKQR